MDQIIELDCAPGSPRPGDLIGGVIEGTGLPVREPVSMLFGCWAYDYSDIDPEIWAAAKPTIGDRIKALHYAARIRYGSW